MDTFIQKFAEKVTGTLECFDRVIFKGHLRAISYAEGNGTDLSLLWDTFCPLFSGRIGAFSRHAGDPFEQSRLADFPQL